MDTINSISEDESFQVVSEKKPETEIEIIESIKLFETQTSCSNYNL